MKKFALQLCVPLVGLLAVAAFYLWQGSDALHTQEEGEAFEAALITSMCGEVNAEEEQVDRWLLQQSWFYDADFEELAGAFGRRGFNLFERNSGSESLVEGVFCIKGKNLLVRYIDTSWYPIKVNWSALSVEFGFKIKPLGQDTFSVRELSEDRMILVFASSGEEHVFYRKN